MNAKGRDRFILLVREGERGRQICGADSILWDLANVELEQGFLQGQVETGLPVKKVFESDCERRSLHLPNPRFEAQTH